MQKFQSVWLPIRERLKRAGDNNKHANTNAIWAPLLSLVVLVVHPGGSSLLLNLIFVKKTVVLRADTILVRPYWWAYITFFYFFIYLQKIIT